MQQQRPLSLSLLVLESLSEPFVERESSEDAVILGVTILVLEMEDSTSSSILEGAITGIKFGLATRQEICTASISDCPISHSSQLSNPFLGLPLEFGKCESCGTSEPGKCEGHFGYIELPIPIYHPSHVSELKKMLSLLCLNCLKIRNNKIKSDSISGRLLSSCCEDAPQISICEVNTTDGSSFLELKLPSKSRLKDGFWNFLEKYGFRYGGNVTRALLPCEVMEILKRIPNESRKKLVGKEFFPQEGYIMQYLPVPPNCLSLPEVSDGATVTASDPSISMLKKVLKQVEIIKSSRSGTPNFESHEVEFHDLQSAVNQYLQVRGTVKASRDADTRFGIKKESDNSSTKAWLDKMRTLFIKKASGFSSRSVISGDAYKGVNEIGIPSEIAQRITFEERVNLHNLNYLQEMVDNNLCLTYRDGSSTYSLREGSKGHTFLRPGQVVHRRIMDGDYVFINRPPTTHKHSLLALKVYVHDDHTVKINPLICGPLSADFDGDCVHLFYPQSLAAKAEVLELFAVDKQLLSSHNGKFNLQLATDAILSLKLMFKKYVFDKAAAQQLAMFVPNVLPQPALFKGNSFGPLWTAMQILQSAMPSYFDRYDVDLSQEAVQPLFNEFVTSIFFEKGPKAVLSFFDSLQPLLMESLYAEGFSIGLEEFSMPREAVERLELSVWGDLIDLKSISAVNKVVQQIGLLGLQLADKGKLYSKTLAEDMASHFERKIPFDRDQSTKNGFIKSCFFHGLNPFEAMVHSISTREVMVRSSKGLSEPGTLFKNLMAILRDVVICYDGTVRNVCSNSIIQFEYGVKLGTKSESLFPAGEPVGVLAATSMSNPAYKAVLDSSPSSNSSWELMKEILLCKVGFKNDVIERRIILYLNDCGCGKKYCRERAVYLVKNHLKKVSLKDIAVDFLIESQQRSESFDVDTFLVGHIHLNKKLLKEMNVNVSEVLQKCQDTANLYHRKKKVGQLFKKTILTVSECCSCQQCCRDEFSSTPCLMFFLQALRDIPLEKTSYFLADIIYPVLLETVIKGDPRICSANIVWVSPETTTWIRNPARTRQGELAMDIVLEKSVVKQSGEAWRIVMDSCLPILHLIDTTRSVPYAIKQVQELLGVSCAFDQAVQRLSTSVTMVAKGVLKEHLILLANSMTCAGNLVGFNSGGYKALSRSLNFQAPFTDATLFTPKRCFERAAEKCHVDSLKSIVASCSWGKHVAVGTGSRFDIVWNTREDELNQKDIIDVYDFLHMLRGSTNGDESINSCLGEEIDDLMGDEAAEWSLSPEHNPGYDKPSFEDMAEQELSDNEKAQPRDSESGAWESKTLAKTDEAGWGNEAARDSAPSDWISWQEKGAKKLMEDPPEQGLGDADKAEPWGDRSRAWESTSMPKTDESSDWTSWGKKEAEKQNEEPPEQGLGNADKAEPWVGRSGAWESTSMHKAEEAGDWNSWGEKGAEKRKDAPPEQELGDTDNPEQWGHRSGAWETRSVRKSDEASWGEKGAEKQKDAPPEQELGDTDNPEQWGHRSGARETRSVRKSDEASWGNEVRHDSASGKTEEDWARIVNDGESRKSSAWDEMVNQDQSTCLWTSDGSNWKNKSRPLKSPRITKDNPGISGLFTATRQRLDMFTSDEEKILSDIEPLMQSIRRIIHQSGYNDGDPLSADDQSYILKKVFEYHPDKAVKMGTGIDYLMISKHTTFQESRCFYIVSIDGHKQDFSYRKSLDNLVRGKYPDLAEEFIAKYFRKPVGGGNRERNVQKESEN
ncbi:DNA-directed RNA polymerase V subunit 1-like isoform X2 [Tripterygium wilfordii]|uniref:DNA-directed RNA polymerase V subunit 1-like isoform X2 n=1 Tax=Tripterygium wilfordii TaxID=458696 RepID=UPI0018F82050|nr:DNA-directed RNA polymerase V subunit 1-like isoform X2 [Tripterygium wilfordii]